MNLRALAVAMFAVGAGVVQAGEVREVRGGLIDEKGRPVAAADVSYTWRANGPANDKAGKPFDLSTVESQKAFWGHVGEMALFIDKPAKTGPDGRFLLSVRNRYFFVMAMDEPRHAADSPSSRTERDRPKLKSVSVRSFASKGRSKDPDQASVRLGHTSIRSCPMIRRGRSAARAGELRLIRGQLCDVVTPGPLLPECLQIQGR